MLNPIKICDVVFLSYKEDNKEVNWERVKSLIPKAKRVDGVKGFDAAHRAVGEIATTEYVIVIDGDNWLTDDFIYDCFIEQDLDSNTVLNFGCINEINGLVYENGGVKIWPRHLLLNLQSHENASSDNVKYDFCYSDRYFYESNKNIILSITVQNSSFEQAFTSGFRETIKQCMIDGVRVESIEEFKKNPKYKNKCKKLFSLLNVGIDVPNGIWSVYGARIAFWNMWNNYIFDINSINDIDNMYSYARDYKKSIGDDIVNRCHDFCVSCAGNPDIPIMNFTEDQSKFFKSTFSNLRGLIT